MTDNARRHAKRINRQRWKAIFMHSVRPGGREAKSDGLIIQYSVQYRRSTEPRRRHTFVFHLKQVDIAVDASPVPPAPRRSPQFSREYSRKNRLICTQLRFPRRTGVNDARIPRGIQCAEISRNHFAQLKTRPGNYFRRSHFLCHIAPRV